jgi:hypothetical protein
MGRVLGAFLLLLVAGCSAASREPLSGTVQLERIDTSTTPIGRKYYQSTLRVSYHNDGEKPVVAPTMVIQWDPKSDLPEMPYEITDASGDDWSCSAVGKTKVTCLTSAVANPGEELPAIIVVLLPDLPEKISHGYVAANFTATMGGAYGWIPIMMNTMV